MGGSASFTLSVCGFVCFFVCFVVVLLFLWLFFFLGGGEGGGALHLDKVYITLSTLLTL